MKEAVQRLQLIEQNMQALNMQKQQLQAQVFEIEGALKELSSSNAGFKIIGGIMVEVQKQALEAELKGKKDVHELRIESLEKQEAQLKEKAKSLQKEVMKE